MSKLKIGLVQSIQHWHDPAKNREHFASMIQRLGEVDLIVLPEMFSTGFTMASQQQAEPMDGATVTWLQQKANELEVAICGSVVVVEDGENFNRFILARPDAELVTYNKRHLFRMADEHNHYTAGQERIIVTINGVRICPQVCYDLRFPVFTRNRGDYDLLLFVANWPAKRSSHWRALLTARAIENQCYVVGLNRVGSDGNDVTYCGDSGLISANGDWLADLEDADVVREVEVDLASLNEYRAQFPAWQDADDFNLV